MPVNKDQLNPEIWGNVEDRILEVLESGDGFYQDEILSKVQCSPEYLRIKLAEMQRKGLIASKTMPEESRNQNRTPNEKVYFVKFSKSRAA